MPFAITLGCGTWGGNVTTENYTYKHYMNVIWVSRMTPSLSEPSDERLFGDNGETLGL